MPRQRAYRVKKNRRLQPETVIKISNSTVVFQDGHSRRSDEPETVPAQGCKLPSLPKVCHPLLDNDG